MKQFIGQECSILIVDDETALLETMVLSLESSFDKVVGSSSPNEALEIIKTQNFDLVVVDQNMPEMTGIELAKKIHAIYPLMPVMMLTANGTSKEVLEALDDHLVDVLDKPFRKRLLINRIQNVLVLPKLIELMWSIYAEELDLMGVNDFLKEPLYKQMRTLYAYSAVLRTKFLRRRVS